MLIYVKVLLLLGLVTVPVGATVYTYWTRTPQYALLHALRAEAPEEQAAPRERESVSTRSFTLRHRRESLIAHLAAVQNRVLATGYGVQVQRLEDEGRTVVLHLDVHHRGYTLTFTE